MSLFVTIVLDGVGIGSQDDAALYGDEGSNTLAHVCRDARPRLPELQALGLGAIAPLIGVPAADEPRAAYGRMQEVSAGKDSTSGHWELAGIVLEDAFPTYPDGFPADVVEQLLVEAAIEGILGNCAASGTEIIARLGEQHLATGFPIVYTSADSVMQIAAHVESVPLDRLYALCEAARGRVCIGDHAVGRVIARPFEGAPGSFTRISQKRRDYALEPPADPLQRILQKAGVRTISIGKVADLFAGVGFDTAVKTRSNAEGIDELLRVIGEASQQPTFVWANLVDFDQEYGHRNDTAGFAAALESFDRALPDLLNVLPVGGRLAITADHGNDPTFPGTDHTREYVPILIVGEPGCAVGERETFSDHAATVAEYFDIPWTGPGRSILRHAGS